MISSKPLVIYHGNCADGFGAFWAVWKYYKGDVEGYPGVYQEPPPNCKDRDVIFVDFSYKHEVVSRMSEVARSITIIDHHKSAIEDLNNISINPDCDYEAVLDVEHSGAMLAWMYFFPRTAAPPLLQHIEDRDLWKFKLSQTRDIQAWLFSHPYAIDLWNTFMEASVHKDYLNTWANEGSAIERKHFKDIAELLEVNTRYMSIADTMLPVANLPYTMASDGAHQLAKSHKGIGATYFQDKNGNYRFSLRSTDDCGDEGDVSKIAVQYGGGGHKHAAGFTLPYNQMRFNAALRKAQDSDTQQGGRY